MGSGPDSSRQWNAGTLRHRSVRVGNRRPLSRGAMAHFTPLDTTFNHLYGRRSIKIFIDLPVKLRQFSQRRLPAFSQKRELRITPFLSARTLPNVVLRLRSEI